MAAAPAQAGGPPPMQIQLPPEFAWLPSEGAFAETPGSPGGLQRMPTPHTPLSLFDGDGWQVDGRADGRAGRRAQVAGRRPPPRGPHPARWGLAGGGAAKLKTRAL
jgi:hypothetical protein